MAPRQEGQPDPEEDERARYREKLDIYEAMGLEVGALRELLERDLEAFKAEYMAEVTKQLEGEVTAAPLEDREHVEISIEPEVEGPATPSPEEPPEEEAGPPKETETEDGEAPEEAAVEEGEGPTEEAEPEGEPEEEVEILEDEEEMEEELELELEGAGPEEALAAIEGYEEEPQVPEEEGVEIAIAAEGVEGEVPEEEAEGIVEEEGEAEEEEEEEEEAEAEEAPEEEAMIMVAAEPREEEGEAAEEEAEVLISGIRPEERAARPEEGMEEEGEGPEEEVLAEEAPAVEEPARPKVPPVKRVARPAAKVPAKKVAAPPTKPPTKAPTKPPKKTVRPKPKTVRRRRGLPKAAIAAIIVVMVVIASLASYFMFLQNEDPRPIFKYSPDPPQVGDLIEFNAQDSVDPDGGSIIEYSWDFGDGTKSKGRVVRHSFLTSETFVVKLTVKDDKGGEGVVRRSVSVGPLTTSMAPPMEGDHYEYDVTGNASIWNSEGLYRYDVEGIGEIVIQEILVKSLTGTRTFDITQIRKAPDGFMVSHDVRTEETVYDLDASGKVITNIQIDPNFTGTIAATVEEDICLAWDRTIRSWATLDTSFDAYELADFESHDEGWFYGQLDGIADSFSMDSFLRTTEFSSEDSEPNELPVAGGTYVWRVKGMERVPGMQEPALRINVTMDGPTLAGNDLDHFFTDMWVMPGLSQPVKTHLFVKGRQEANRFRLQLTETLQRHTEGDIEVPTSCIANHSYSAKGVYATDFRTLGEVPERGGTGGGFRFSPLEALDAARVDIPDLDLWLVAHPSAFMHMGNYSDRGADARWVLALGEEGSQEHYRVTVRGTDGSITSTDARTFTDSVAPLGDRASIGEVVTLTRGLILMRAEPDIASKCFVGSNPNWGKYTFNVSESVPLLSTDPASALATAQEDGYIYSLHAQLDKDDWHRASLDATNGQILYSWLHEQDYKDKSQELV